jgi:hypothetical protein
MFKEAIHDLNIPFLIGKIIYCRLGAFTWTDYKKSKKFCFLPDATKRE